MSLFRLSFFTLLACALSSTSVFAAGSGGLRNETPDAGAFGKGSAFVGEANTPGAVYYNPAGLTQIKRPAATVGYAVIAPQVDHTALSGDTTQMRRNKFGIPHFYAAIPVNEQIALGVGVGSYWGLGVEWAEDSFARFNATKIEMKNIDTMLTGAYKINDQWSFALSVDNDYSKVNKNLKALLDTDAHLSLKAKSDAWGYRVATMFKINDQNQLGLMYRSRVTHKYIGKVYLDHITGVSASGAVFNSSQYETRATQKMVLPQSVVLGYSLKPAQKWTINFDIEWMDWSAFEQEIVDYPDETNPTIAGILTASNPSPHDWASTFSYAIGTEYAAREDLRLRTGYFYHNKVGPQDHYHPAIIDNPSHGMTVGLGYDFTQNVTLDLAYSLMIYEPRKVDSKYSGASGTYKQLSNIFMGSVTYKF